MELTDVDKNMNTGGKVKVRKPYVAPQFQRLSAVALKVLLSRRADASDTQLQQMIEGIDQLHGAKGS